jgi:hypothetical protein
MAESFPLVPIAEGSAIPGNESIADRYFAPEINRIIRGLNAVEARLRKVEPPTNTPSPVILLTAEQEAALIGVPLGGQFTLKGPTFSIVGQVNG